MTAGGESVEAERRRQGTGLCALLGLLLTLAIAPTAASASDWAVTQLSQDSAQAAFYANSCPGPDFCAVVGGNGTIAVSTAPTGGPSAWRVGRPGSSYEGSEAAAPGGTVYYGGAQIRGVSCPTAGLCVAASLDGRFYTSTDPAGDPTSSWKVVKQAESGPNIHMFGVSCPSTTFCVVVGYAGKVLTATDPTGDSSAWTVTQLPKPYDFRGVSCPTATFCVAVANEGQIVASGNPAGGPGAWNPLGAPAGESSLNGVSCPSVGLCVTGTAGKIVTSTSPANAGSWNAVTAGTGLPVTAISCPTTSACVAVDNNADVLTSTDPTGGAAAWSFENQLRFGQPDGNGMFGISCPSATFCAAGGQRYQVITSTDPFAVANPIRVAKGKRPRAVITRHPGKRVEMKKGGAKVVFRFRSVGRAVRFQCKLQGRRYRTCEAPKRYRVGAGKTFFRVRAIGPGGLAGPPATFHFRVGKLTEREPYGSCENAGPRVPCING